MISQCDFVLDWDMTYSLVYLKPYCCQVDVMLSQQTVHEIWEENE